MNTPYIADISAFMRLGHIGGTLSDISTFNIRLDDIEPKIKEWMRQIDLMRAANATVEADAEEDKLEGLLNKLSTDVQTAIKSAMVTLTELNKANEEEVPEEEAPLEDEGPEESSLAAPEGASQPSGPETAEAATGDELQL